MFHLHYFSVEMYSCTDLYQNGARKNQIYYIFISTSKFKVYCDFESEANSTWTLIVSFALKNKGHFNSQLGTSAPVNGDNPNWDSYRYLISCIQSSIFP